MNKKQQPEPKEKPMKPHGDKIKVDKAAGEPRAPHRTRSTSDQASVLTSAAEKKCTEVSASEQFSTERSAWERLARPAPKEQPPRKLSGKRTTRILGSGKWRCVRPPKG